MGSDENLIEQALLLAVDLRAATSSAALQAEGNSDGLTARLAEFALIRALARSPVQAVLRGQDWLTSAVFSPQRDIVLTGCNDGTVVVWDVATGDPRATFELGAPPRFFSGRPQISHDGAVILVATVDGRVHVGPWDQDGDLTVLSVAGRMITRAALSPDGGLVFAGLDDNTARLWTWREPGDPLKFGERSDDRQVFVSAVAFSSTGRQVAAGTSDGTMRAWAVQAPGRPIPLQGAGDYVNAVVFGGRDGGGEDDRVLAAASDDGTALVYLPWLEPSVPTVLRGHRGEVNQVVLSADGRRVATASVDRTVRTWTVDGRAIAEVRRHRDEVLDVAFSPDRQGTLVASASADGTAVVAEAVSGDVLLELAGHTASVFSAQYNSTGRRLVTASADFSARVWEIGNGTIFRGHALAVNSAELSRQGHRVVTSSDDRTVRIWDPDTGAELRRLREFHAPVNDASFNPDGTMVIAGGGDGDALLWAFDTEEPPKHFPVHRLDLTDRAAGRTTEAQESGIITARFSGDGRSLLIATLRAMVIWPLDGDPRVIPLPLQGQADDPFAVLTGATRSPDGRFVLTAQLNKTAQLLDAATGEAIRSFDHDPIAGNTAAVYSAAFDKEAGLVVTAGGDGVARVWETDSGRLRHRLVGPSGQLRCAAFSADSTKVAAGGVDGDTQVWDVASERVIAVFRQHAGLVNTVATTADGNGILTASDDRTARLSWFDPLASLDELLATTRRRLGHDT